MHPIPWLIGRALRYVLSLLVGGLMYVSDRVGLSAKLRLSSGWPTTEARIESRQMVRDPKGKEVVCRLGYSYVVNGEYYAGLFERLFSSDTLAAAFLRQMKDGQRFTVRYKARAPQKSVVDPIAMKLLLATPAIAPQTVRATPHFQQPIMGPNPADTPISPFVGGDLSTMSSPSLGTQTLDTSDCPSTENTPQLPLTLDD
jgi:hypothetical protein